MEDGESKIAEGAILGAVCGWENVWHGFTVACKLIFVWKGLLLVLLNEYVSAKFSRAKGILDRVETVAVIVFSINVWPFVLFGWLAAVWLIWI